MPVGGLVCVVLFVVLLVSSGRKGKQPAPRPSYEMSSRPGFGLQIVLSLVAVIGTLGALVQPWLWVFAPLVLGLLFPWQVVTRLTVPRGLVRSSWAIAWRAFGVWSRDRTGGQLVAATLALLRRDRVARDDAELWLLERLAAARRIRAGTAVAAGLLAADGGERDLAAALFAAVEDFDPRFTPGRALGLAADWRQGDAAQQGDWQRVARVCRDVRAPSHDARFLAAVANRLTGVGALTDNELTWAWSLTSRKALFHPLLDRARAAPVAAAHRAESAPSGPDPLTTALDALQRFDALPSFARTAEHAHALGRTWEVALASPVVRERLALRSAALGGGDPARVLATLREAVVERLVAVVQDSPVAIGEVAEPSALAQEAAAAAVDARIDEVEVACRDLDARVKRRIYYPPAEELTVYARIRAAYDRAVALGGADARRVVYPEVNRAVCNLAVDLYNDRDERILSNAMSRWLLREAELVHDEAAADLHRRNIACLG